MDEKQPEYTEKKKRAYDVSPADEILKPLTAEDLVQPMEDLQKTSAKREWEIKRIMEKLGVSRDIAEKMVDESGGSWYSSPLLGSIG